MGILNLIGDAGQKVSQGLLAGPEARTLSEEERKNAGKHALRDMGLSLIMAGSPPGAGRNAPSPLAAIAMGAQAGRASYADYAGRSRQADATSDIAAILDEGQDLDSVQAAFARAVQGGDLETARTLGPVVQSMMAAESSGSGMANLKELTDPLTGQVILVNPATGVEVMRMGPGMEGAILPAGLQTERNRILTRHQTKSANVADVANSYRRVLSATNTLIGQEAAKQRAEERGEEYTRPTAAAMAAISSFARLLDPGSVVREGEFHIVSNQGSMVDRIKRWWEQIMKGTVPVGLANALQDEAFRQTSAQQKTMQEINETAWAEGVKAGIKREWMPLTDPFESALEEMRAGELEEFDYDAWSREQSDAFNQLSDEEKQAAIQAILEGRQN